MAKNRPTSSPPPSRTNGAAPARVDAVQRAKDRRHRERRQNRGGGANFAVIGAVLVVVIGGVIYATQRAAPNSAAVNSRVAPPDYAAPSANSVPAPSGAVQAPPPDYRPPDLSRFGNDSQWENPPKVAMSETVAQEKLARANELFKRGNAGEGAVRNTFYAQVSELCLEIENSSATPALREQAGKLRAVAKKVTTVK
jgi:hypothetical protein